MSVTKGPTLLRLGVMVMMEGVISLSLVLFWFSPLNRCSPPAPAQDQLSQTNSAKSKDSLTETVEKKPILPLWVWPQDYRFDFSDCKKFYNIDNCQLTNDRSLYNNADNVIVYHRDIQWDLSNLPPSPRPPFQRWIWLHLESPTNTQRIPGLENLLNLTLSYRQDADSPVRLRLTTNKEPNEDFVIPQKDKLVCWIVNNNLVFTGVGTRNSFYQELSKHIQVTLFGKYARFLDYNDYYPTIASCKCYLDFENSIQKDYITEKINGPLAAGTAPSGVGSSEKKL